MASDGESGNGFIALSKAVETLTGADDFRT